MTGNFPSGSPIPPAFGPVYPVPPKQSRAGVWLGAIACVLAAAALSVGVVSIVTAQHRPARIASPQIPKAVEQLFVPDADKKLCESISPLMREETDKTRIFTSTGGPDSPERLSAIPQYKIDMLNWADRIQPVLNRHSQPPRYLTRTLQNYVDGVLLYSENMYQDRGADPFDDDAYTSAVVFYGGPLGACWKVGVRW
jgi:hypothetical protein